MSSVTLGAIEEGTRCSADDVSSRQHLFRSASRNLQKLPGSERRLCLRVKIARCCSDRLAKPILARTLKNDFLRRDSGVRHDLTEFSWKEGPPGLSIDVRSGRRSPAMAPFLAANRDYPTSGSVSDLGVRPYCPLSRSISTVNRTRITKPLSSRTTIEDSLALIGRSKLLAAASAIGLGSLALYGLKMGEL